MPTAMGTTPARSNGSAVSPRSSQPNTNPSGGIRKCKELAAVTLPVRSR
jgi:hypothetical protein